MASKSLIDIALKLSKQLGANTNKFLGTRSNISFLGKGPKDDLLFQADLNVESLPAFPLNKLMPQIESSMGYLTGGKLNDIQATKLISNLEKIKEFNFPTQTANIIDLGTGTRNLTEEGLGALRQTRKTDDDFRVIKDEVADDTVFGLKDYDTTGMSDVKQRIIQLEEKLGRLNASAPGFRETAKPLVDEIEALQLQLKNETGLMSRIEGQMENIRGTSSKLDDAIKGYEDVYKPRGTNEIDALETMTKNKAGTEFITGYVDELYRNSGVTASVDIAKKRAAAREFLFTMLKKETDLLPPGSGGTLESVITPTDYKFITEGGGGPLGDPLVLVKKYFGDEVAKRIPLNSDRTVIEEFVDNVRFTKDKGGFATDDPRFNPDDLPEFKHGGLAQILEV